MIFAIRGLLSLRAHFDQPLLHLRMVNWLNSFPKLKKDQNVGAFRGSLSGVGMKARADVLLVDDPSKSIEERITAIANNLTQLRYGLIQQYDKTDDLDRSHRNHKEETEKHLKEIKSKIRSELETLHVGDFDISLVGLALLTIGITLSTLSQELYQWVN